MVFRRWKVNITFSKSTFFPDAIIEWNKVDPTIWNTESFGIFKSNILIFIRPAPKKFFNCYNNKRIKLITRLRLELSHLCEHKFNDNAQNRINSLFVVVVWILLSSNSLFDLKKKPYP